MQPKRDRLYFPFGERLLMVFMLLKSGGADLKRKGFLGCSLSSPDTLSLLIVSPSQAGLT